MGVAWGTKLLPWVGHHVYAVVSALTIAGAYIAGGCMPLGPYRLSATAIERLQQRALRSKKPLHEPKPNVQPPNQALLRTYCLSNSF